MGDGQEFPRLTRDVLVIVDEAESGGIIVTISDDRRESQCLSRGAVRAYRSLLFSDHDSQDYAVSAAAEQAYSSLTGTAEGPPSGAFGQDFLAFARNAPGLGTMATAPLFGAIEQRQVTSREELKIGARVAPLDPGVLRSRKVGSHTAWYHHTAFRFPAGTLSPNDSIEVTGREAASRRFAQNTLVSSCTVCGVCGGCAACTLCAEVNFGVAASFLVSVDFVIHLSS